MSISRPVPGGTPAGELTGREICKITLTEYQKAVMLLFKKNTLASFEWKEIEGTEYQKDEMILSSSS